MDTTSERHFDLTPIMDFVRSELSAGERAQLARGDDTAQEVYRRYVEWMAEAAERAPASPIKRSQSKQDLRKDWQKAKRDHVEKQREADEAAKKGEDNADVKKRAAEKARQAREDQRAEFLK